jgi:ankyrin repeat protein
MPGIIISYRHEHTAGSAGRLVDRLGERFGKASVFIDILNIEPGADFVDVIERAVATCDALLVLISREWADCVDSAGRRRLENANDFVRQEIAVGLRAKVRLIPILIDGAVMPAPETLPEDLRALVRRKAAELRHSRWDADVQSLIAALEKFVPDAGTTEPVDQTGRPVQSKLSPVEARIQLSQCSLTYDAETFIACVKKGDLLAVRLFLTAGMDPNTKNHEGHTALMWAVDSGRMEVLEMLLEAGARVDERNNRGVTALHWAVSRNNMAMLHRLRERGADVQAADKSGETALSLSAAWDNEHMLDLLLKGASIEALNRAFVSAAAERRLDVMRIMLDRGARVTDVGSEALLRVVWRCKDHNVTDVVTFLLDAGVDVNAKGGEWDASALFIAVDLGASALANLLLKRGADVDSVGGWAGSNYRRNMTPLQIAASHENLEIVEPLLAAGARVHHRNSHGKTALHLTDSVAIVRALLSSGADVNARDDEGHTPLMLSGGYSADSARALLENGADINAKDNNGWTALMHAAKWNRDLHVHALLESGADVNERNGRGETALILAIAEGRSSTGVVRELLERGASAAVRDASGKTPLDYAEGESDDRKRASLIRLLEGAREPAGRQSRKPEAET